MNNREEHELILTECCVNRSKVATENIKERVYKELLSGQ